MIPFLSPFYLNFYDIMQFFQGSELARIRLYGGNLKRYFS